MDTSAFEAEISIDLVWEGWKDRKQEDCDRKQYRNISHYDLFAFSFFHLKEWWGQLIVKGHGNEK